MSLTKLEVGVGRSIGERLVNLRKKNHLSQTEFAKQIGFDASYVSKIEKDLQVPSLKFLKKSGEVLSVSPGYFLASEDNDSDDEKMTDLVARFKRLNEEDKKSIVDFFKFILEQQNKKDAEQLVSH